MARLKAPRHGCAVRMYRHGLGDCFLLAFANGSGHQKYVLVDCGVLLGTSNANEKMRRVVENIADASGGRLHALVVTHEHWDHVSGFLQAQDVFTHIEVDELWLAWTEDESNALARELKERGRIALDAISQSLAALDEDGSRYAARTKTLLGFYGEDMGAAARKTTAGAMKWVKERWSDHRYLTPGMKPPKISGLPDVRFFVLGPPQDKSYLKRSRPRASEHEVYLRDPSQDALFGMFRRMSVTPEVSDAPGSVAWGRDDPTRPFSIAYERDKYHGEVATSVQRYEAQDEAWRRIDREWMEAAGELALKLDQHTNNTSLALAIEFSPGKKVLLFPGDAQVGNWLSWHEISWTRSDGEVVNAEDLLSRTVVYKVGHHASHNATLSDKGLELMTSPALLGLIPVDRETARKRRWSMPHPPLHDRLRELTDGHTYLADEGVSNLADDETSQVPGGHLRQTDLYLDLTLEP